MAMFSNPHGGSKTVVKSMNNEKDQKTFDKHLTIV